MITKIFNSDILKILTIFSIAPGSKLARKELQEKTKMTNVNLDNALNILINSKIIVKEKRLLALNFENELTKQIINLVSKQYRELRELPLAVFFSILEVVNSLSKIKRIDVYLFGSFAKLVFKETSDIDLAIIGEVNKKEVEKLISKIELRYSRNIEIHYFSKDLYKNKKDPIVKDILRNGIKLI